MLVAGLERFCHLANTDKKELSATSSNFYTFSTSFYMSLSTLRSIRKDLGFTERTSTASTPDNSNGGLIKHFYQIPLITLCSICSIHIS